MGFSGRPMGITVGIPSRTFSFLRVPRFSSCGAISLLASGMRRVDLLPCGTARVTLKTCANGVLGVGFWPSRCGVTLTVEVVSTETVALFACFFLFNSSRCRYYAYEGVRFRPFFLFFLVREVKRYRVLRAVV